MPPKKVPLASPSQQKLVTAKRMSGSDLAKREGLQIGPDGLPILPREISFGQLGLKTKRISYTKAEVIELKCIFDKFDLDDSGDVSAVEISLGLRNEKGRWQTLAQHLNDTLKDIKKQKITFYELIQAIWPTPMCSKKDWNTMLAWTSPKHVEAPPEPPKFSEQQLGRIRALFALYDRDGSGELSPEEIRDGFQGKGYSGEELTDLFCKYDLDQNAQISVDEFVQMMTETFMVDAAAFQADIATAAGGSAPASPSAAGPTPPQATA